MRGCVAVVGVAMALGCRSESSGATPETEASAEAKVIAAPSADASLDTPDRDVSPAQVGGPKPIAVAEVTAADRKRWETFAKRQWWRAGEPVRCDGTVESVLMTSAHEAGSRPGQVCIHPNGEQVAWWERGDAACPEGTQLTGAPPPIGPMLGCLRPDGTGHGPYSGWDASGALTTAGTLRDGKPASLIVNVFPEGGAVQAATLYDDEGTELRNVQFLGTGQRLVQVEPMEDTNDAQLITSWHANGVVSSQGRLVGGRFDGEIHFWGEHGQWCGTSVLHRGTGTFTKYWSNCAVESTGELVDGDEVGVWKQFDREGRPLGVGR